jgi:hypothetical protein
VSSSASYAPCDCASSRASALRTRLVDLTLSTARRRAGARDPQHHPGCGGFQSVRAVMASVGASGHAARQHRPQRGVAAASAARSPSRLARIARRRPGDVERARSGCERRCARRGSRGSRPRSSTVSNTASPMQTEVLAAKRAHRSEELAVDPDGHSLTARCPARRTARGLSSVSRSSRARPTTR